MNDTLPLGVISLDTAVELIARHARHGNLYPTIVYRNEADAAWRKLCALSEDHVRPLMLTSDGVIQKVDRTQFFGFADKYWKFASVLRYPPNGEDVQQEVNEHCPSHDLLDESGRLHRGARLVFLESEIEMAFDAAADPGAIDVARIRPPTEEPDRKPAGDEAPDGVEKPLPAKSAQNKVAALAAFVRQRYPTRPPKSVDEFMEAVKNEASHIGKFKKRTFESALAMAYPQP
jgi:hypothetical protein